MKKQIILTLLFFLSFTVSAVEYRWVTSETGLRMRSGPSLDADKIGVISYYERVILLKEEGQEMTISGASGKWSEVNWNGKIGWVFGGFLTEKSNNDGINILLNYKDNNFYFVSREDMDDECELVPNQTEYKYDGIFVRKEKTNVVIYDVFKGNINKYFIKSVIIDEYTINDGSKIIGGINISAIMNNEFYEVKIDFGGGGPDVPWITINKIYESNKSKKIRSNLYFVEGYCEKYF